MYRFLTGLHNINKGKIRSKSNFDCRNGFLGVDYICLDTSHGKIENFSKIVRGGQPPLKGGSDPQFFSMNQKIITNEACMQNFRRLAQKLWICTPTLIFFYFGRSTRFAVKRKVKFDFRFQKWIPCGRLHMFEHLTW